MDIFTYPKEDYKRQTDIVPEYVEQSAIYASKMTGKTIEFCREYIRKNIAADGTHPMRDPKVTMLQRVKTGDRVRKDTTFGEYLWFASKHELILVPTMTVYLNPNQRKSFNAEYIIGNMNKRKVYKGAMLLCKQKGDAPGYGYNKIVQDGCKIKNNSMSGAHSSPSTPLFNKSNHSTLTSCCRISTSYANANNECLIRGNRHYHHPQIVFADLISVSRHYNLDEARIVIAKYDIHIPTIDEVMKCITYSSRLYWHCNQTEDHIRNYVSKLDDTERAMFVYKSDLYHMAMYNPSFVRGLLGALSTRATVPDYSELSEKVSKDGDIRTLAILLCSGIMKGKELFEVKETNYFGYGIVMSTMLNIYTVVCQYADFIRVMWRNPVLPPSIAKIPNIIRRTVVTSDTDSSIFTNQYWTQWFTNGELFSEKTYEIGYAMTYLAAQTVKHKLALMSANLGFIVEHRNLISMKNEYYFPVYSLTSVAKHYYGFKSAQEGRMLPKLEAEIKGVHLRDSSAPPEVTDMLAEFIHYIMNTVMDGKKLKVNDILDTVAELELSILDDIASGGYRYMKSLQIKDATGYSQGDDNPSYKQYLFWNEVFGPSYGDAPPPPYDSVKAPIAMTSRTKFTRWLNGIEDAGLRLRLEAWAQRNKYEKNIVSVPLAVCTRIGLPPEIRNNIAVRKLVRDIVSPFYTVLESIGLYYLDENSSRLISDGYTPTKRRVTPVMA